jgi:hypothetical protein
MIQPQQYPCQQKTGLNPSIAVPAGREETEAAVPVSGEFGNGGSRRMHSEMKRFAANGRE